MPVDHLSPEELAVLVSGGAEEGELRVWWNHVEGCASCRAELAMGMEVRDIAEAELLPSEGWNRWRQRAREMLASCGNVRHPIPGMGGAVAVLAGLSAGIAALAGALPEPTLAGHHDPHQTMDETLLLLPDQPAGPQPEPEIGGGPGLSGATDPPALEPDPTREDSADS